MSTTSSKFGVRKFSMEIMRLSPQDRIVSQKFRISLNDIYGNMRKKLLGLSLGRVQLGLERKIEGFRYRDLVGGLGEEKD